MPRLVVGTVLLATALPLTASAQPAGDLSLDTFRPAIDSRGYLTLNASQPLGHKEVSFGLGSLTWGLAPASAPDLGATRTGLLANAVCLCTDPPR